MLSEVFLCESLFTVTMALFSSSGRAEYMVLFTVVRRAVVSHGFVSVLAYAVG